MSSCESLSVTCVDSQPIDVCGGSVLIERTVTIVNGAQTQSCVYTMTLLGDNPPVIACPVDRTISLGPGSCGALSTQPLPTVYDLCGATMIVT